MTADEAIQKAALAYLPPTYRLALKYLEQHRATSTQLAEHLGLAVSSARNVTMRLRKLGVICVADYVYPECQGGLEKVWTLGAKSVIARKRPKQSSKERSKRWREKQKVLTGTAKIGVWGL